MESSLVLCLLLTSLAWSENLAISSAIFRSTLHPRACKRSPAVKRSTRRCNGEAVNAAPNTARRKLAQRRINIQHKYWSLQNGGFGEWRSSSSRADSTHPSACLAEAPQERRRVTPQIQFVYLTSLLSLLPFFQALLTELPLGLTSPSASPTCGQRTSRSAEASAKTSHRQRRRHARHTR